MNCAHCIIEPIKCLLKKDKPLKEEYTKLIERWPAVSLDNISYLVRENESQYLVFLDKELDIDWITTEEYEQQNSEHKAKRSQILSRVEFLQHQPIVRYINRKMKKDFNCLLAESWVYALESHFDMANECINRAEEYISNRNFELSRKWQVVYSLIFLGFFLIITIFLRYNALYISQILHIHVNSLNKILYTFFGAVGATLSIIQKTGRQFYNCESGKLLHAIEAFSRLLAGMISGLLIIYMVDLDLIFSSFKSADKLYASIIIVTMIAGFSERLVPSIISRFETSEVKGVKNNDKKSAADI